MPSKWPGFRQQTRRPTVPIGWHVEGVGLDVEELTRRAETTELPFNFCRRCTVRHQHSHPAECLKAPKQLLPPGNVKLGDSIRREGSDDLDFWNAQITGQGQGHLPGVLFDSGTDAILGFIHRRLLLL
jgi:hypothetical protein